MIYHQEPENFKSAFEVSSCFLEHDGDILLLHRQDHKPQGNTWGLPAGKVDQRETALETIIREIREETGYESSKDMPTLSKTLFVRYPEYDFVYHIFHVALPERPDVVIEPTEHKDFQWKTPQEALQMELIPDLDACIELHYNIDSLNPSV